MATVFLCWELNGFSACLDEKVNNNIKNVQEDNPFPTAEMEEFMERVTLLIKRLEQAIDALESHKNYMEQFTHLVHE